MTALQVRNFEAWGTTLEMAFFKKLAEINFFRLKRKDPTEDHTTPFEVPMVAGSLKYPSGHWKAEF
jgi:hypothetical protein